MGWREDGGYRALARRSPRPSKRQIRNFAHHVSEDHSWYKRLPFGGDGEPFFLYLSPHVHEASIETGDGGRAWRSIVYGDDGGPTSSSYAIDVRAGDVEPDPRVPIDHYAGNMTTAIRHRYLGRWNYWNFGPPDQPRAEAIASAVSGLRVPDDSGEDLTVPAEVLDLGLVYLRATISPRLGPEERRFEEFRRQTGGPSAADDRQLQLAELVLAMRRVVDWVYET